jgi:hypothetical protein
MMQTGELRDPLGRSIGGVLERMPKWLWVFLVSGYCVMCYCFGQARYSGAHFDLSFPVILSAIFSPGIAWYVGILCLDAKYDELYECASAKRKVILVFSTALVSVAAVCWIQHAIFGNENLNDFSSTVESSRTVGNTVYRRASGAAMISGGSDAYALIAGTSFQVVLIPFAFYCFYLAAFNITMLRQPLWQHPNPTVREECIESLTDMITLRTIVQTDSSDWIRKQAQKRIDALSKM